MAAKIQDGSRNIWILLTQILGRVLIYHHAKFGVSCVTSLCFFYGYRLYLCLMFRCFGLCTCGSDVVGGCAMVVLRSFTYISTSLYIIIYF